MREGLEQFYAALALAPEDWSIRLRLLEAASAAGDLAEARRLVRSSPDGDRYLPGELQERIHALLVAAMGREGARRDNANVIAMSEGDREVAAE